MEVIINIILNTVLGFIYICILGGAVFMVTIGIGALATFFVGAELGLIIGLLFAICFLIAIFPYLPN